MRPHLIAIYGQLLWFQSAAEKRDNFKHIQLWRSNPLTNLSNDGLILLFLHTASKKVPLSRDVGSFRITFILKSAQNQCINSFLS